MSSLDMSKSRAVKAYLGEARYECVRMMRSPTFALLALLMPLAMYLFLGVYLDGILSKAPPARVAATFGHWCVFSVMWPGMFGFGASVALERSQGLIALKCAMPVPLSAYLLGKSFMSVLFALAASILISLGCAILATSNLSLGQFVAAIVVSTMGGLLFAAIGLFVGSLVRAQHATGVMYLVYIPLMLLAGLFFPVPHAVKLFSPAFYLDRVVAGAIGQASEGPVAAYLFAGIALTAALIMASVRTLAQRSISE